MAQLKSENQKRYKPYDIQQLPERATLQDNLPISYDKVITFLIVVNYQSLLFVIF